MSACARLRGRACDVRADSRRGRRRGALARALAASLAAVGAARRRVIAARVCDNAVRTLRRAAGSLGVLRLSGQHGLDADAALGAAASLFALPLEAKRNASIVRGGFQRGYIPMGGEAGLATNLELKEGFCYGYPWTTRCRRPTH